MRILETLKAFSQNKKFNRILAVVYKLIYDAVVFAVLLLGISSGAVAYTGYVVNSYGVGVFDTTTHIFENPINLGAYSGHNDLAMTPDGRWLYASRNLANEVAIIDTTTKAISKIDFGTRQPDRLLVTPDGKHVYIHSSIPGNPSSGMISVIDTATNTVIDTFTLPFQTYHFRALAPFSFSADGRRFYTIHTDDYSQISMIDTATHAVMSTFSFQWVNTNPDGTTTPVIWSAYGLSITPDGGRIYITGQGIVPPDSRYGDNTAAIIMDTTTNALVGKVPIPQQGFGRTCAANIVPHLTFTPDGHTGYLLSFCNVFVLDTSSNQFVTTISGTLRR